VSAAPRLVSALLPGTYKPDARTLLSSFQKYLSQHLTIVPSFAHTKVVA
jgi:hypothetical protein